MPATKRAPKAPAPEQLSPAERAEQAPLRAVLFAALANVAAKEGDRDALADGAAHEVEIRVDAKIDGAKVALSEQGQLTVGYSSESSSSSGAPAEHVLALALAELAKTKKSRDAWLENLPHAFELAGGKLPAADPELLSACARLFERLRSRKTITKRGSVHFKRRPATPIASA